MKCNEVFLIFPHQLFQELPQINDSIPFILIEESLFFNQYPFHKQKLAFHRASMKAYEHFLNNQGKQTTYINAIEYEADIRILIEKYSIEGVKTIHIYTAHDNWLNKRINNSCVKNGIKIIEHSSSYFINTEAENKAFFKNKKKFFHADFYIQQRKKLNLMVDKDQQPEGGKWSFDEENRLKYPKGKTPPKLCFKSDLEYYQEANIYINTNFENNPGEQTNNWNYPCTHEESKKWLNIFLEQRFEEFGPYEDAIVSNEDVLHHSVLSPLINVGLLTPLETVEAIIDHTRLHHIPLNSQEGLIRQLIGWREFINAVYQQNGTKMRTTNYWNNTRSIPSSFWDGTTGIIPIDTTIKKVLKSGYCHHIERLMVIGNFMLLCEFDPDEVYHWFSSLFIDAYDWVMVPNVYGMSQFADGGIMATKPYISGSNYLLKMSDYPNGKWQEVWDGLFWNFMNKNRNFFLNNPRLSMLIHTFDKMPIDKKQKHLEIAQNWLVKL